MSEIVASFGTGFVLTTIVRCGEGDYRWTRRPGPRRGGTMPVLDPVVLAAVRTAAPGRVRLTLPERGDGSGVTYRTDRSRPVAAMFLGSGSRSGPESIPGSGGVGGDAGQIVADTFAETGATLAKLHAVPLPRAGLPSPEGPRRLLSWLLTGQGPGAAPDLRHHAAKILGHARIDTVAAWCAPAEGPRVLLHGAPSQGILLPVTPDRDGHLLIGEDLAAGPPESDVGWLIGELVEFRELARRFGHGAFRDGDHDAFIVRVLDGYPAALDLAAVGRAAALRFLSHVHDFAAYVKWHNLLLDYLELVAGVVDAADAGRLLPSPSRVAAP